MLVIRMQRTGRRGHAQFRVVVQDSRRTPTSGKIVAALGHFNPHTKETSLDKEKAAFYLEHGAQPSDRVVRLLTAEGVKLPKWVTVEAKKQGTLRNPEKLRKNRPAESEQPKDESAAAEEAPTEDVKPEDDSADAEVTPAESEAPAAEAADKATEAETATDTEADAEAETVAEATPAESDTASETTSEAEQTDQPDEAAKEKA